MKPTVSPRESVTPLKAPKNGLTVSPRESVRRQNGDSRTHVVRHLYLYQGGYEKKQIKNHLKQRRQKKIGAA